MENPEILDFNSDKNKQPNENWSAWIGLSLLWIGVILQISKGFFEINQIIAIALLGIASFLFYYKYVLGIYATVVVFLSGILTFVQFFPVQYSIAFGIKEVINIEFEILVLSIFITWIIIINKFLPKKEKPEKSKEELSKTFEKEKESYKKQFRKKTKLEIEKIANSDKHLPAAKQAAIELLETLN